MEGVLVTIPTYDERDNVRPLSKAILDVEPDAHVLFVDDNSPDGTGKVADELAAADGRIKVLHNPMKGGQGRAYLLGFRWALERGYKFLFQMDADFSHDPREIPNFLKAVETADLVLGTRYLGGIRIVNWPLRRLILSKFAGSYVRTMTGLSVSDPTGGFKCFRRATLEAIDLNTVMSDGYSFHVEMTHIAWMHGARIGEVPITFVDRRAGYSKMSPTICMEAFFTVLKLAVRSRFHRRKKALK